MRRTSKEKLLRIDCNVGMDESGGGITGGPLYQVRNLQQDSAGDILRKRDGYTRYDGHGESYVMEMTADTGLPAKNQPSFFTRNGKTNLVGTSRGLVFGFDDGAASGTDRFRGTCPTAQPVRTGPVITGTYGGNFGVRAPSSAVTSGGYICTVGEVVNLSSVMVQSPSGQVISHVWSDLPLGFHAKVIAVGAIFVLVYQDNTALEARKYTPGGSTIWTDYTAIETLHSADCFWDICAHPNGTSWYLVSQTGATEFTVDRRNTSLASIATDSTSAVPTGGDPSPCTVSVLHVGGYYRVFVGWYDDPGTTGDVNYTVLLEDLSATVPGRVGPTTITSAVDELGPPLFSVANYSAFDNDDYTAAAFFVIRGVGSGTAASFLYCGLASVASSASSSLHTVPHLYPVSKPDAYNRVWCITEYGSEYDCGVYRYVLVRFAIREYSLGDASAIISRAAAIELSSPRFLINTAALNPLDRMDWFSLHGVGAGNEDDVNALSVFPVVRMIQSTSSTAAACVETYQYQDVAQWYRLTAVECSPCPVVSGNPRELMAFAADHYQRAYDADADIYSEIFTGSVEVGWALRPSIKSTANYTTSGSMTLGTYSYVAVFQWIDDHGRRHLSAPSAPVSHTIDAAATKGVTLTVMSITATLRRQFYSTLTHTIKDPVVLIFRTLGESGAASSVYHYANSSRDTYPTDGDFTITDTAADATIADEEFLYTEGGVLENDLAPSCRYVIKSADRLWCGGLFDRRMLHASKILVPGEPPNFADHASFKVLLPEECTGLAHMDGTVVAFTETGVYVISGEGPNDQGIGSFDPPRRISEEVGCAREHSIVETEAGIVFWSRMGLYRLPRGFGPLEPVGQAVREFTGVGGDGAYCWGSAVRHGPSTHQARWLVSADSDTESQYVIVYDVLNGQWTIDEIINAGGGQAGDVFANIGAWSEGFVLGSSDLTTSTHQIYYQRNTGSETTDDGSTYIVGQVKTAWRYPFGMGGWGRVEKVLVALEGSDYSVDVTVETDAFSQTETLSVASAGTPFAYREVVVKDTQCSAVRVTVEDSAGVTPNTSFGIAAIVLQVDDSDGIRPLSQGESA